MKIALLQTTLAWEDPKANIHKAGTMMAEASSSGCSIAVLPEMFTTGFSMMAHTIAGAEAMETLAALAARNNIALLAGVAAPGSASGKGLNKALAFDSDGTLVAQYAKIHPFTFAGEHEHYAPGPNPIVFQLAGMASSVFICYDLRFPEAFRAIARRVGIVYVLANWPAARQSHWSTLLKARAIEDQCYVVGVNRVGADGSGISYHGGSAVYGPFGEEVFTSGDNEGVFVVEIDPAHVDEIRAEYPFLNDMRT